MTFCNAEIVLAGASGASGTPSPGQQFQGDSDEDSAPNRALTPVECGAFQIRCSCYGPRQLKKIFDGITDLSKCQIALAEKDAYIKDRLVTWGAGQPIAWWQEPSFVFGGLVVSISVTALLTTYALSRK